MDAAAMECIHQRDSDRFHVTVSAHFGYEPSPTSQRAPDSGDDFIGLQHPVQRRVTEYRVEFIAKLQRFTRHHASIHSQFARRANLHFAAIDSHDLPPHFHQSVGQPALTPPTPHVPSPAPPPHPQPTRPPT